MTDLSQIKQRQQGMWASGDFHKIGVGSLIVGERLCEDLAISPGEHVLDVACGSGNTTLAVARRGAQAIGVDFVPALLERARIRAEAEGLEIEFLEGDAENLPFDDDQFDVVTSSFGAMFAPDQKRTASELLRVLRPHGRIGVAAWTPAGFSGELFRVTTSFLPPPPGVLPPTNWGNGPKVAHLFGDRVAWITLRDHTARLRAPSAEAWLQYHRTFFGPTMRAFEALDEQQARQYTAAIMDLVERHNRATDGTVAIGSEYVNVIAIKH